LCIKTSTRRTSSRFQDGRLEAPVDTNEYDYNAPRERERRAVDQKEYQSKIGSLLYLTVTSRTSNFLCVCALIFMRRLHISMPSSGLQISFDTLLSMVFGTRRPLLFRFLVSHMPTSRGVESIRNRLRVLASLWVLRLFLGLLGINLV
jgi:hypothetical protein